MFVILLLLLLLLLLYCYVAVYYVMVMSYYIRRLTILAVLYDVLAVPLEAFDRCVSLCVNDDDNATMFY